MDWTQSHITEVIGGD